MFDIKLLKQKRIALRTICCFNQKKQKKFKLIKETKICADSKR